MKLLICIS